MTLYRHCDGPDCTTHQKADGIVSFGGDNWITTNENLDFCSWRCVQEFAKAKQSKVSA